MPTPASETLIQQPFACVTGTAAAATAVTVTVAAVPGVRHVAYLAAVSVSGAASGPVTLTINDGATAVLVLDLSLAIGTPYLLSLPNGVTNSAGNALSAVLSTPAASCIGKVTLGYDSY